MDFSRIHKHSCGSDGFSWIVMYSNGSSWILMDSYGFVSVLEDSRGFLWILCILLGSNGLSWSALKLLSHERASRSLSRQVSTFGSFLEHVS